MMSYVFQCSVKLRHFSKFKDMTDALAGEREREGEGERERELHDLPIVAYCAKMKITSLLPALLPPMYVSCHCLCGR